MSDRVKRDPVVEAARRAWDRQFGLAGHHQEEPTPWVVDADQSFPAAGQSFTEEIES